LFVRSATMDRDTTPSDRKAPGPSGAGGVRLHAAPIGRVLNLFLGPADDVY